MDQAMIASEVTDGQIENLVSKLRDALRKHRSHVSSAAAQLVLELPNIGMDLYAPIRHHIEMVSNLIIRRVVVNRARTARAALEATGRQQYVNHQVAETMPRGVGEEVEVIFFKFGRFVSDSDLDQEYALRGLVPVDPYSLAAVNEADPAFADDHPNGTHWQNARNSWCSATFCRWSGERRVDVNQRGGGWSGDWWFAGLRKT